MSPEFDVKKVLEIVGPTASLLFAAWIFLQYLNQRFTESVERLRDLAENLRQSESDDERRQSLFVQIRLYVRRCALMRRATGIGLYGAVLLLTTLTLAAITTIFDPPVFVQAIASLAAVGGLMLVLVATVFVILENRLVATALHSELDDLHLSDSRTDSQKR